MDITAAQPGMTVIQAVLLGLLQGVAEFLPISSSGHLAIAQELFGLTDIPLLFDVLLHVATLAAVVLFFRKRIGSLFGVLGRWIIRKPAEGDIPSRKMIVALLCGTAVTGVIGILIQQFIPDIPVRIIPLFFIFTGALLIFSARFKPSRTVTEPGVVQGLLTGLAQGIGVFPGISRSGITISAALIQGIDRNTAGEFSFLLSIPAIIGAFILEIKDLGGLMDSVPAISLIAGCVTAFAAGLLSLMFLMKLIRKGRLDWFAWYLIPAGILGIFFIR